MTALHTDGYRRFVEALVAERQRAGLSQRELAARVGMDYSIIAKLETCVRRVDVIELIQILRALGVVPSTFMAELEEMLFPLQR